MLAISLGQLGQITATVILISAGQLLFKAGARSLAGEPGLSVVDTALRLAFQPAVIAAGVLYVIATLIWLHVLREVPLSFAYPFISLSFLLVPIGSHLIFGEQLSARDAAGMMTIVTGVTLMSWKG